MWRTENPARLANSNWLSPRVCLQARIRGPTDVAASAMRGFYLQEQFLATWYRDYPQWIADNNSPFFTPETSDAQTKWASSLAMHISLKAFVDC
jgi:hypothetical protein